MRNLMAAAVLISIMTVTPPVAATNSSPELKIVLGNLMSWLPGEYDNAAQVFFEREQETPEQDIHQRIYRAYHRVDAPAVGENVLLFEVRNGGKHGPLDMAEYQVWILSLDSERKAVRMSPRRFVDEKKHLDAVRDPALLRGLTAADLKPGEGVAGCDIWWRLRGRQLVGMTAPGACKGTSRRTGEEMDFTWEFTQNEAEQWIGFAGRDAAGNIVFGREDQTEWRLDKARDFECLFGYSPPREERVFLNGARMHDRGDVFVWEAKARTPKTFHIHLIRGMWPSRSGRNFEDLLRIYMYDGDPGDPPDAGTLLGVGWAGAASDRASFSSGVHNARCKLFDPSMPPPRSEQETP